MGVHESGKGERDEAELQQCRRPRQIHQRTAAHRRTREGHGALQERHEKGENEGEMTDLYQHAIGLAALLA